ncbi:hypothetical protein SAMN06296241_0118 [Salinimicrobium sediminis]|uniref:Uncharacterized protein n=1 Tax=Salinimicrobium sediminis TaxID=1343891 RepID=A0A285X0T0_9FLAO|nr:hypothetical protein SAMN06296241_0118 [Salinimicrobium sediminis]
MILHAVPKGTEFEPEIFFYRYAVPKGTTASQPTT